MKKLGDVITAAFLLASLLIVGIWGVHRAADFVHNTYAAPVTKVESTSIAVPRSDAPHVQAPVIPAQFPAVNPAFQIPANVTRRDSRGQAVLIHEAAERSAIPIPPFTNSLHEIDLLDSIKPEDDLIERSGRWTLAQKMLISSVDTRDILEIPYRPPQEYDFTIEFARIRGNDGVIQMVSAAGTSFSWVMDGYDHTFGFENVRGAHANGVPSSVRTAGLVNGRTYVSTVQVRKNGVRALLDGKLVVEIATNYNDLSSNATRRDPLRLGLRTWNSETIFHSIKVTEISGVGTVTSHGDAATNAVSPVKRGQDTNDSRPSIILDASKITEIQIDNFRKQTLTQIETDLAEKRRKLYDKNTRGVMHPALAGEIRSLVAKQKAFTDLPNEALAQTVAAENRQIAERNAAAAAAAAESVSSRNAQSFDDTDFDQQRPTHQHQIETRRFTVVGYGGTQKEASSNATCQLPPEPGNVFTEEHEGKSGWTVTKTYYKRE